jgi:glycopeptide antibiotics resistance protein
MSQVYIETIAMYVTWTVAMLLLRGKARRIVAIVGAVLAFALILVFTVLNRSSDGTREISLIPFITFENAKAQPELYRTMFMNVLLFMPFGLSLPFALNKKIWYSVCITALIGLGLSICVEVLQYVFFLGRCETDDIIMNVLGVLIGTSSFVICQMLTRTKIFKKGR